MTPVAVLERADDFDDAQPLHVQYDVVPYPKMGPISGFYKRGTSNLQVINARLLLSGNTSIVDLPELLLQNHFYFVLSANTIVGYVHYSDLNRSVAKIPYFTIFQAAERAVWGQIEALISEDDLAKALEQDVKPFLKRREDNRCANIDLGWVGVFSLPHILKLARFYGCAQLTDDDIELLRNMRNRVSHSDWNLLNQYDDVQMLIDARMLAESLLR
jgi:hypothetical protein